MLRFLPFLLIIGYGFVVWHFSARRLARELDERSTPLNDPALTPMLLQLALALGHNRLPVFVYEVAPINGLAAPDGRVFLTRGFLNAFKAGEVSADELASVIAHELGHVSLGHSRRRMIDFNGQNALRVILSGILGRILPGIGVWLAQVLTSALAARLSRRDEFEADEFATALMIKAGFGTAPQVRLFEKLPALTGGTGSVPAWLMSHPETGARIAAIRKNEARWSAAED
ncbi:M48 family metallopeptidase [Phaeovulum sp. W22_SRMD_FR3]|uniref:M48 family metallopeptidase n=1 Tax=Phaeovulum sp. W22_SRMD_FR3 TaxID=3240274 RepID=UPI003F96D6AB